MTAEEKITVFRQVFPDEDSCLQLLASLKWEDSFVCSGCGNTNYCNGKSPYSRRCTRCKKDESVMANTPFHRCKIPLNKAFEIALTICNVPDTSSYHLSRQTNIRHMTCYSFQKKMINCQQGETSDPLLAKVLKALNEEVVSPQAR